MALHFKFRSAVEYDSVNVDGHFISVIDLKEKIIEAKNLGKGADFDLLITNAQTGEEYADDAFLVPKNTSVIIKRVPAVRTKTILRVDDRPKSQSAEPTSKSVLRGVDGSSMPLSAPDEMDENMDDFGVDLYALPELMTSKIGADEDSRITALVTKTASDWQRQSQETFPGGTGRGFGRLAYGRGVAKVHKYKLVMKDALVAARSFVDVGKSPQLFVGRGFWRALPPQGYVCHRCSQPGHFIQHCPTNGDPAYDLRRVKLPVGIPKTRLKADQEGGYILPDGSVAVMQPDETVFAKEAGALLSIRPTSTEPPPELRCPLCQAIFKDAVMIPCCHYSFCDKCIRQELISKGMCPQCGSSKHKNDDLLPNIALRQAIDRFMETQASSSNADEGLKPQRITDAEPVPQVKAIPPVPRLQIELRKPVGNSGTPGGESNVVKEARPVKETRALVDPAAPVLDVAVGDGTTEPTIPADVERASIVVKPASEPQYSEDVAVQCSKADESVPIVQSAVVKDVSDPVKGKDNHPVIDDGGGTIVKMSEPTSHKEAEGVAVESEVSKASNSSLRLPKTKPGKKQWPLDKFTHSKQPDSFVTGISSGKKKKRRARLMTGDGAGDYVSTGKGKRMQGDRSCFICGSPDHLARDCFENPENAHPPPPGMFGAGPPGMPPFGPEMYWQGPPVPQHGRPFPMPYGERMYGPGPMPFETPMVPPEHYNVTPFMPPMYRAASMHGGFMGNGMPMLGSIERPLSREEFMEMQERERLRRMLQERLHRDWSPEKTFPREGNWWPQTPDSERRRLEGGDRRGALEDRSLGRKHDLDRESARNNSDEIKIFKQDGNHEQRQLSLHNRRVYRRNTSNSDDDIGSFDGLRSKRLQIEKVSHDEQMIPRSLSKDRRSQREEEMGKLSSRPEDDRAQLSYSDKFSGKRARDHDVHSSILSGQSQEKCSEERKTPHLSTAGGNSHSSGRLRSRTNVVSTRCDVDYDAENESVRSGRHTARRSKSQEQIARLHLLELSGSETDFHGEVRVVEKPKRHKHRSSHSKSKAELGSPVSESEEDLKKKKKKHKKPRVQERSKDGRRHDWDGDHNSRHRKHRAKNGHSDVVTSAANLDPARWQLDSGNDIGATELVSKDRHRHRHSDNGKSGKSRYP